MVAGPRLGITGGFAFSSSPWATASGSSAHPVQNHARRVNKPRLKVYEKIARSTPLESVRLAIRVARRRTDRLGITGGFAFSSIRRRLRVQLRRASLGYSNRGVQSRKSFRPHGPLAKNGGRPGPTPVRSAARRVFLSSVRNWGCPGQQIRTIETLSVFPLPIAARPKPHLPFRNRARPSALL